jgi:hypothetical protein
MRFPSLVLAFSLAAAISRADTIHVIDFGVSGAIGPSFAVSYLTSLGHSVTTGGTLTDYSAFDQVWDLRYTTNLGAADVAAFGSYLSSGGRLYLTGENPAFDDERNDSLRDLLFAIGGGNVAYSGGPAANTQTLPLLATLALEASPTPALDFW